MGQLRTHEKIVGGLKVWTTELSFTRSTRLETRLARILMHVAPLVAQVRAGQLKNLRLDGLMGMFNSLDGDQLVSLMIEVFASTSVLVMDELAPKGEKVELTDEDALNRAFNGKALTGHEVLWYVIGVNFETFGRGLLAKFATVEEAVKKDSPST